jgi:hypothetical protein
VRGTIVLIQHELVEHGVGFAGDARGGRPGFVHVLEVQARAESAGPLAGVFQCDL